MKFRNCFIDENGNVWRTSSLIEKSKGLPLIYFDLSLVDLDTIIRWKLVNVRDYLNHHNRILNADLKIPIILRSDGFCMDGWHRIIKGLSNELKILPAKQFITDPEPDFNIDD